MDSILTSIKKLLGPSALDTVFDIDLIMNINTAFSILCQLGAGPPIGFYIKDQDAVWTDFLGESAKLEMVKTYVFLKAKLYFDPPTSAAAIDAIGRQILELEWRIMVAVDPPITTV